MAAEDSSAELDQEQLETWAHLATLLEWLPPALDAPLQRDAGLTHFEYGMLYALADAPERTLRMSTLASYANSTLSRLSRAASRMERRGWMVREPDPEDGRFTCARLTHEGAAQVALAAPGHAANVQALVFDSLTRAQARQLGVIAARINETIRENPGWAPGRTAGADPGEAPQPA